MTSPCPSSGPLAFVIRRRATSKVEVCEVQIKIDVFTHFGQLGTVEAYHLLSYLDGLVRSHVQTDED